MDAWEPSARLTKASLHALQDLLEGLFANPVKIPGTGLAEVPVIGDRYRLASDHSVWLPVICAALCAREKFRAEAPGWPPLPLREEEIEALMRDDDHRSHVLAHFGGSLRGENWHPEHPCFSRFVSGLLAYPATPDYIRNDPVLRREFPPRELDGLRAGWTPWRSSE